MDSFIRSDGRALGVVEGFRDRVLSYRASVSPKPGWTDEQLQASAQKKKQRFERLRARLEHWLGPLHGARVLDLGCGDGSNCVLLGGEGARLVVGLDLRLRFLSPDGEGELVRKLLAQLAPQSERPASFVTMDATRLGFRGESFDAVISRSAAEHIRPIESALAETFRVVRPGGLVYLAIDPFFWLRGCHKRGVVDIPFAHARLTIEEYRRFVGRREGESCASRRAERLQTLNRLTVTQWRHTVEREPWEILDWAERPSELGRAVLKENPEILDTLLPGVAERDLLTERIEVWLRKR